MSQMTIQERNKFAMIKAVYSVLTASSAEYASLPAMAAATALLGSMIEEIKKKEKERNESAEGKRGARDAAQTALINAVYPIACSIGAYASEKKNVELAEKAKVTKSELQRLRPADLSLKANSIHDLANSLLQELAGHGVTEAVLANALAKDASFNEAVGGVNTGSTGQSAAISAVENLFKEGDVLLHERLDKLMEVLKEDHLQFYDAYFAARVIKDLGTGHSNGGGTEPPPENPPTPPQQ